MLDTHVCCTLTHHTFAAQTSCRYSTPGSYTDSLTGTLTLLGLLKPHVGSTPLIAAGGIMTGQQVVAALAAGAAGVQLVGGHR